MNPLKYKPAQIAKSLVALLTGVVGLLGMAASAFADGPLSTVGGWAAVGALAVTPVLVFLQKAEPFIDMLDSGMGAEPRAGE